MKHILLVDDELNFLEILTEALGNYCSDWHILTAENGLAGIDVFDRHAVDLIVTDLKMPVMDGYDFLTHILARDPQMPLLVMTADSSQESERKLTQLGIDHYLSKPFKLADIARAIEGSLSPSADCVGQGCDEGNREQ